MIRPKKTQSRTNTRRNHFQHATVEIPTIDNAIDELDSEESMLIERYNFMDKLVRSGREYSAAPFQFQ